MPKFIHKPVEIEAVQFIWDDIEVTQDEAEDLVADFMDQNIEILQNGESVIITAKHLDNVVAEFEVNHGDWVVKCRGEYFICPDKLFQLDYTPCDTWLDRVIDEQAQHQIKLDGINKTLAMSPQSKHISKEQFAYMGRQQFHMTQYNNILLDRIGNAELDQKTGKTAYGEIALREVNQGSEQL